MDKMTDEQLEAEQKEFESKLKQWRPLLVSTCKEILVDDRSLEYDDVMSKLYEILLKSIRGFDPSKGNKFITYLMTALKHKQSNFKDERIKRTNYTKDEMIHVAFIKQKGKWIPLYDKDPVLATIPLHVAKFQIQNENGRNLTDEEVLDYYDSERDPNYSIKEIMDGELLKELNEDEKLIAETYFQKGKQSILKSSRGIGKYRYEKAYNSLKYKLMKYFRENFTEKEMDQCQTALRRFSWE